MNQKGGSAYNDLSQRLVLVENRPRLLELACSLVAASLNPQPPAAAAAVIPAFLPGLVRKLCSSDAPFPGKVVSRPCRVAIEAKATVQQPSGWFSTMAQAWLSSAGGGGGDAISAIVGGGGRGVCECAGRGPCTIRASPGREPCLHVEVGDVTKRRGGSSGAGFSAESVESTSAVRLRTYSLATTTAGAASPRASSAERRDATAAAAATAVSDALVTLHAAAVRLGLPSSVAVPVYAAMLLAGVALLLVAQPLSESRAFHYLLSALLGGGVGAAVVLLRAVKNPRRSLLRCVIFFSWGARFVRRKGDMKTEARAAVGVVWCCGRCVGVVVDHGR